MEAQHEHSNSIRTYKLRGARITHSQEAAIERHWQTFGVEIGDEAIDLHSLFPDLNHVVLEIGTGMGEATAEMAAADPTIGIVALEIHRPGIGSLLWRIDQSGVTNVRIIHDDVMLVLPGKILDGSIDEIRIYFPDPWPKLRHHKRRLLQGNFLNLLAQKLRTGGLLHIATDWQPYADWIAERLDQVPEFSGGVVSRPANRTFTRFEKQGLDKEHQVTDFHYFKK